MCTKLPEFCSRKCVAQARLMLNEPCRCTLITSDQSDQLMRWKMRSRRMPALLTRMSTRPKASSAALTILSALPRLADRERRGDRLAAGLLDLVDHLLRRAGIGAGAFEARADVADDDARALLRHQERDAAADAAPRAGDDGDLAGDDIRQSRLTQSPPDDPSLPRAGCRVSPASSGAQPLGTSTIIASPMLVSIAFAFLGRGEAALRRQAELVERR